MLVITNRSGWLLELLTELIKNPQNNEILPLTFQKDYHESKIYPIVPRWAKQYFQTSNYIVSDDLFED